MQTVFITGGTGVLGTAIMKRLLAQPVRILALTRSASRLQHTRLRISEYNPELQELCQERIHGLLGDLTKPHLGLSEEDRTQLLAADVIIHAGGSMNLAFNEQEANRLFVEGTRHLLAVTKEIKQQGSLKHMIHISGYQSPYTEMEPWDQTLALQAKLPYDHAKLLAEREMRLACRALQLPLSVVQPGVLIGDTGTGSTEQLNGFGLFVDAVRRSLLRVIPGSGDGWLPLVAVDTAAAYIGALAMLQAPRSDTYPLLDSDRIKQRGSQLAKRIARELYSSARVIPVPKSWVKRLHRTPLDRLAAVPCEAEQLYIDRDVDITSTLRLQAEHGLPDLDTTPILSAVIADLDYRVVHNEMSSLNPISPPEVGSLSRPIGMQPLLIQPTTSKPSIITSGYKRQDMPITRGRRGNLATWEIDGSKDMPILVFLHGAISSGDLFLPLASHLLGIPMWFIDLPGFGRSPVHRHPSYIDGTIIEVMQAIKDSPRPVVLAGHSFGGTVAYRIMEQYPELIHHLLLIHPVLQVQDRLLGLEFFNEMALRTYSPNQLARMLVNQYCYNSVDEVPHHLTTFIVRELRSPRIRRASAKSMSMLSTPSTFKKKKACKQNYDYSNRISVLWGFQDMMFKLPEDILPHHISRMPYGHLLPVSHPEETAEWIKARFTLYC